MGALLLAEADAGYIEALRGEVAAGLATVAGFCPWFDALWEKAQRHPVGVVVAQHLLVYAQDDAAMEARRQAATTETRDRLFAEADNELRRCLSEVLALTPNANEDLPAATVSQLLDAFNSFQQASQRVLALGSADPGFEALRRATEKLSTLGFAAQRALAEAEEISGVNAIFLAPQRLAIGVVILAGALLLRAPVAILLVLAAAALAVGYRWYAGFRATDAAIAKLRHFGLHGKALLRASTETDGDKVK